MVVVGFVIQKSESVSKYINKFVKVFSDAKVVPMSKSKLFDPFRSVVKNYKDRIVFIYSGEVQAFSLLMFFVKYVFVTLVLANSFFYFNGNPTLLFVGLIALAINVFVIGVYTFITSKYYLWLMHKKTFKKPQYKMGDLKSKLLSNEEVVNCLLSGVQPKFKDEL